MGRFFIVIAFQSLRSSVAVFTELLSRCSTRVIILWLILGEAVIIHLIDPSEENVQALSVSVFNHEPVHRHVPARNCLSCTLLPFLGLARPLMHQP